MWPVQGYRERWRRGWGNLSNNPTQSASQLSTIHRSVASSSYPVLTEAMMICALLVGTLLATVAAGLPDGFNVSIAYQTRTSARTWPFNAKGNPCTSADVASNTCLGGISRRATVYKEILANTSGNAIFVDGGNALCIDPSYSLFRGQIETFFMQMFNFTGITPGALDFMYGSTTTSELDLFNAMSRVPILSTNMIRLSTGGAAFQRYTIRTLPNGVKVAIMSSTGSFMPPAVGPTFTDLFGLAPSDAYLGEAIGEARAAGADIIVVLTNGIAQSDVQGPNAMAFMQSLEATLAKYAHFVDLNILSYPVTMATPIDNAFGCIDCPDGVSILRIDLKLDSKRKLVSSSSREITLDKYVPNDPETDAFLAIKQNIMTAQNQAIDGISEFSSSGEYSSKAPINSSSTGDIVADAYLHIGSAYGATIAIVNWGAIRGTVPAGNITHYQTQKICPFADTVSVFKIDGVHLLLTLQRATKLVLRGAFPQVAGLRWQWLPNMPNGNTNGRITAIEVMDVAQTAWVPFDINRVYTVATNSYMRLGGDEYALFPVYGYDFIDNIATVVDTLTGFFRYAQVLKASQYAVRRGTYAAQGSTLLTVQCQSGWVVDPITNQCKPCPPGTAANVHTGRCQECQDGWYSDRVATAQCLACPTNARTYFAGAVNVTQCQCIAGYYGSNGGQCTPCSNGGYCSGGDLMINRPGYVRSPWDAAVFFQCIPASACAVEPDSTEALSGNASQMCNPNYTGLNCGTCAPGAARGRSGNCSQCPSQGNANLVLALLLVGAGIAVSVLVVMYLRFAQKSAPNAGLHIAYSAAQVFALYPTFSTRWPSPTTEAFTIFRAFSIDVSIVSFMCAMGISDFQEWLAEFLLIPFFWCCSIFFFAVSSILDRIVSLPGYLKISWYEACESIAAVTTLSFPMIARHVFQVFECTPEVDGRRFLLIAPSVLCYDSYWTTHFLPVACVFLAVLLIAIPVYVALQIPAAQRNARLGAYMPFAAYTRSYRREMWYWNFISMVHAMAIVLLVPFTVEDSSQRVFLGILIQMIICGLKIVHRPFLNWLDNTTDAFVSFLAIGQLTLAFFYNSPVGLEPSWSQPRALFDVFNLIFTVVIVVVIIMTMARSGPVVKLADNIVLLRKPTIIAAGIRKSSQLDPHTIAIMPTARPE
ncbi:Tyrosine-protein kinase ephrin type A/B receptor-like [Plasmodiophora brassicae]